MSDLSVAANLHLKGVNGIPERGANDADRSSAIHPGRETDSRGLHNGHLARRAFSRLGSAQGCFRSGPYGRSTLADRSQVERRPTVRNLRLHFRTGKSDGQHRDRPNTRGRRKPTPFFISALLRRRGSQALSSEVHWGQRVAFRGTVDRQKGHSFVVGAAGASSRFRELICLMSTKTAKATMRKVTIELMNRP